MSFRNRCTLAGANGKFNLTVPLSGGRDQREVISKDIRIDNSEKWQHHHLRSIISAYNRSPFFEHYRDAFFGLYEKNVIFLIDWNLACLEWLQVVSGMKLKYELTDHYVKIYEPEKFEDLRDWFFPRWMAERVSNPVTYRQVFQEKNGFIPNLSVLDFLFCEGPGRLKSLVSGI